ncbi:hypothetical protein CAPTEDRAFT_224815 [Capitella teleta]|uniref:R3H domain-containing protein n=1 Tax=Capitella teleta TaxID=283909 RepID=R7UU88_CAPTE|nr:hypothetical protein CAPTEDRAFT_224815 [Capitella teleta]|eukprot:ELU07487.1 hypothetical protein CAPTEDRAFT_224815 [Capitella teleta]
MMRIDNIRCDGDAPNTTHSNDVNRTVLVNFTDHRDNVKAVCESPKRSPRKTKRRNIVPRDERRRSKGAQQRRREENLQSLMSEKDLDDEELDFFNIREPNFSAFAALFFEQEKMMVWNDFMNRTEEDQHEILNGMKELADDSESGSDFEELLLEAEEGDVRSVHPAFTAEEGYMRINRKLRAIIRKRDLPTVTLRRIEDEITDFFTTCPKSVYISQSSNSFTRLLVHTLSQYLNLVSKSFETDDGVRRTQVENKHVNFTPPSTSLADYLEAKH